MRDQRRVDDDDDNNDNNDGNGFRPLRTPPTPPYDFPLYNTPVPSPPTSDGQIERTPAAREEVPITEKVKFSENLNKLFSKADEIFNKNDEQKPSFDDVGSLSKPDEMAISWAEVI